MLTLSDVIEPSINLNFCTGPVHQTGPVQQVAQRFSENPQRNILYRLRRPNRRFSRYAGHHVQIA